jgi:hypothetical protein
MHLRYLDIGIPLSEEPLLEILLHIILPMDEKDLPDSMRILAREKLA